MASPLQNAIEFFREFGLFDVVLPFLLVFALIFAILEKTKILGTEGKEGDPKKNLNTLVAFVVAMMVVATNKVVNTINVALPNITLIIVAFVAFLMMIGVFYGTGELKFHEAHPHYFKGFVAVSLILLILILLNSLTLNSGQTWLSFVRDYVVNNLSGPVVTSFIFLIVAVAAIIYITKGVSSKKE